MSRDLQPQKRTTETAAGTSEEAVERDTEWYEACAAVDDAYCEWLHASAEEWAETFAAYRAALDWEASVATSGGVAIDGLRLGVAGASRAVDGERALGQEPPAVRGQGVRVLIADNDGFACRMLQRALAEAGEIAMVSIARDGREAMELVRRDPPDVLLVDIGVPPSGGVELIRLVVAGHPHVRIVTVSAAADWDQAVLAALRAGSVGHIDKDTAPGQIARLVLLAAGAETVMPERLMKLSPRWHVASPAHGRGAPA